VRELNQFLRDNKDRPFEWGNWDCLIFTNEAWKAMYGFGWADDWLGRYYKQEEHNLQTLTQDQLRKEYGFNTLSEAVSTKLDKVDTFPPVGALVATRKIRNWSVGYGFGIAIGTKAALLSRKGIIFHPIETVNMKWVNPT
jgi:hypothetical protein